MNTDFDFSLDSKKPESLRNEKGWSACDIGKFSDTAEYSMENTDIGLKIPSKIFLKKALNLTGAEISINKMPSDTAFLGNHKHKENEEIIIVISGTGSALVNENEIPLKEGSVLRISACSKRAVKSIEELTYICIQTKENSLANYTLTDAEML